MDPYKVLGVDQNASDDELKTAYRNMVKLYHPDRYEHGSKEQTNAAEKLKQVNAAYDMIQKIREGSFNWSGAPQFAEVRMAVQRGAISEAEAMLNRMTERPAEWHYLMGVIMFRRGWYDGAYQHFQQAHQMEPGNKEYAQAMQTMSQSAGTYMDFGGEEGEGDARSAICRQCLCCAVCGAMSCLSGGYFCCC